MDNARRGCSYILRRLIYSLVPPGLVQVVSPPPLQRSRMALHVVTAPFADPARTEVMLAGLNGLLAKRRASVRFSNHTGLVRSLRGQLYPERIATSADDMLEISAEFLDRYAAALYGSEERYPWRAASQPIIGSCVRLRQIDRSGIPVYGATMVFGFDERIHKWLLGRFLAALWRALSGLVGVLRRDSRRETIHRAPVETAHDNVRGESSTPIHRVPVGTAVTASPRDLHVPHLDGGGQLSIVTSSWYPIAPEVRDFELSWDKARRIALEYVGEHFQPDLDLEGIPGDDLMEGRVIFPWFDKDRRMAEGSYRPAWVVMVVDSAGSRSWQVIVDAENEQVLAAAEATVEAKFCVHLNNAQAQSNTVEAADLDCARLDDNAPHFKMGGRAFQEQQSLQPGEVCQGQQLLTGGGDGGATNGFRSVNVYYHLCRAMGIFKEIAARAWTGARPRMPGQEPDEEQPDQEYRMPVKMEDRKTSGTYNPVTRSIACGLETSLGEDPARDCEVIYHEYSHAVLHVIQPDLYRLASLFGNAINEGLAFYFGCTLSERPQPGQPAPTRPSLWAEFAYPYSDLEGFRELQRETNQQPGLDYLQVYGVFPEYDENSDPSGPDHACGMLWARALWDVRRVLGYEIADALILRGLSLAGGAQSELETPAEAIIHVAGHYAQGGPSHESALRLIFCSRGIMADAPVHDLIAIGLGEGENEQTYILAAIENTDENNHQPGCVLSTDQGNTWTPLGTAGPTEVVALAVVKVSHTGAVIWAAGEQWSGEGDNAAATGRVYRYELDLQGSLNTDDHWNPLEPLPEEVNLLSLTAIKDPDPDGAESEFWLFAGTESGLYRYEGDGEWQEEPSFLRHRQIYALVTREQPPIRLLVGTKQRVYVLDPADSLASDTEYNSQRPTDWVLTVTTDADGHLWAGTAFAGVYRFDLVEKKWTSIGTINRPVYHLLVEKQDVAGEAEQGTQWVLYAGTNNGVYRCLITVDEGLTVSEDWQEFNNTCDPAAEAIEETSVVALCRTEDGLLAGTGQRGLWRCNLGQDEPCWTRPEPGLNRIGRLADADELPCSFTNDQPLPEGSVGTHVLYMPHDGSGQLSFTIVEGASAIDLELYYLAPYTDPSQGHAAGLQDRTLSGEGVVKIMQGPVKSGYYILAVKAQQIVSTYQVEVQIQDL